MRCTSSLGEREDMARMMTLRVMRIIKRRVTTALVRRAGRRISPTVDQGHHDDRPSVVAEDEAPGRRDDVVRRADPRLTDELDPDRGVRRDAGGEVWHERPLPNAATSKARTTAERSHSPLVLAAPPSGRVYGPRP